MLSLWDRDRASPGDCGERLTHKRCVSLRREGLKEGSIFAQGVLSSTWKTASPPPAAGIGESLERRFGDDAKGARSCGGTGVRLIGEEGWALPTCRIASQNWSCVDNLKSF